MRKVSGDALDAFAKAAAESRARIDALMTSTPDPEDRDIEGTCSTCGEVVCTFNAARAAVMSADEVQRTYPRGHCCNSIIYATSMHYIAGDW